MRTPPRWISGPGFFAPNCSDIPSSGWICKTRTFGGSVSTGVSRNSANGTRLNWIAISAAPALAAHLVAVERPHRFEDLVLFGAHGIGGKGIGRLHRREAEQLE